MSSAELCEEVYTVVRQASNELEVLQWEGGVHTAGACMSWQGGPHSAHFLPECLQCVLLDSRGAPRERLVKPAWQG